MVDDILMWTQKTIIRVVREIHVLYLPTCSPLNIFILVPLHMNMAPKLDILLPLRFGKCFQENIAVKVRHDPPRREPRQWHQLYVCLCVY